MKPSIPAATAAVLLLTSFGAQAEICRWKDSQGRTQYSDSPPPGVTCIGQLKVPKPAPSPAPASGDASKSAKSVQELDMEFKKRRQDKQEAERKAQQERDEATQKKSACDAARSRLAGLKAGGRIARYDASGQMVYLGDEDIKREAAEAERTVKDLCR
jgi:hypothetical protein